MTMIVGLIISLSATIGLLFYCYRIYFWRKIGISSKTTYLDVLSYIYWITLFISGIFWATDNINYIFSFLTGNIILLVYLGKYFVKTVIEYREVLTDFAEELSSEVDDEYQTGLCMKICLDEIRYRIVLFSVFSLLLLSFSLSLFAGI